MNDLYEKALDAIRELFNDTDVSPQETARLLRELISEILIMIDTLPQESE